MFASLYLSLLTFLTPSAVAATKEEAQEILDFAMKRGAIPPCTSTCYHHQGLRWPLATYDMLAETEIRSPVEMIVHSRKGLRKTSERTVAIQRVTITIYRYRGEEDHHLVLVMRTTRRTSKGCVDADGWIVSCQDNAGADEIQDVDADGATCDGYATGGFGMFCRQPLDRLDAYRVERFDRLYSEALTAVRTAL